jgi:two-component system, oxyanion-binding sensor
VCRLLAAPHRVGVAPQVIRRTLDGRLIVSPDGEMRTSSRYLSVGDQGAGRPDPAHAAWFYAQMVRWGQAPLSSELLVSAKSVFRPDIFDRVLGAPSAPPASLPADHIGAFAGPAFDANDLRSYLAVWAPNAS